MCFPCLGRCPVHCSTPAPPIRCAGGSVDSHGAPSKLKRWRKCVVELENMTKYGQNDVSSEVSLKRKLGASFQLSRNKKNDSRLYTRWISKITARGSIKTISQIPLEYQTCEFEP